MLAWSSDMDGSPVQALYWEVLHSKRPRTRPAKDKLELWVSPGKRQRQQLLTDRMTSECGPVCSHQMG